jgi:hypothetical protein
MGTQRRNPKRLWRGRRSGPSLEWIGGRLAPSFFIRDEDTPHRTEIVLWLEAPSGIIVGEEVVDAEDTPGSLARVLREALKAPAAGPRRRPEAIRVAETWMAKEVRAVVGRTVPVTVAPTPELDEILEDLLESMAASRNGQTYLDGGEISPDAVERLFAAAEILYRVAPWKVATDDQILRMDIPAFGVDGACVSIIGHLGERLGIMIFPSLDGYDALRSAAEGPLPKDEPFDLGSEWLSLSYDDAEDYPTSMRKEAREHGWRVAGEEAYPCLEHRGRDGAPLPLVEQDVRVAAACAEALAGFLIRNADVFDVESIDPEEFEPVCESCFDRNDLEVRFTVPYEAFPLFDVGDAPVPAERRSRVGRNDPCPCGSGRKYKKCHLPLDRLDRSVEPTGDPRHVLDAGLIVRLQEFAAARFGREWQRFARDFTDDPNAIQLSRPWSVYVFHVRGKSVLQWYLEEKGPGLTREERDWLAAQAAAWLSVWEVTGVEPGESVTVRDLLSGEERVVHETSGSQSLVARDALLGRVVDHDGVSVLCGTHPCRLPPFEAAEVVRRARGRLRRKRAVPVERLRDEKFGRYLIRRWDEAVASLDARVELPRELRNTDGDSLLVTIDHYDVAPGERPAVEAGLAGLEGVQTPEPGEEPAMYVFLRPEGAAGGEGITVVGQAVLSKMKLMLETSSRERADTLRGRVEAACGGRIRHRAREHQDPLSSKAAAEGGGREPEPLRPEEARVIRRIKELQYATWLDDALPALGGKTPREAVRSARGREAVDVVLKDMENLEHRFHGEAAFDFASIRRELKLD